LGQSLSLDVPRPLQCEGERGAGRRPGRYGVVRAAVHPAGGQARRGGDRGASSAASAANAAIDHVRDWVSGADGLRSMAVASDGSYGVAEGIISSFPVRCEGGAYEIVQGLEVGEFAQAKLDATVKELTDERAAV